MNPSGSARWSAAAGAAILAFFVSAAGAGASGIPFRDGESLKYQLRWLGIPMATVRLSVEGPTGWKGRRVFRYRARLKSIGLLKRFYRVDDRAESLADVKNLLSYRIDIHQQEGRYRARRWNVFEKWRTVYGRPGKPDRFYDTFGDLNDVLGAFFKARSLDLQPGRETDLLVFQGKYLYRVFLNVTGVERIDTLWGPVRTLVVEPRIAGKSRLNDMAKTWLWVTDDQFRIPVRLESRTYLGSVVFHLFESRGVPTGLLARAPVHTLRKWKAKPMRVRDRSAGTTAHIKKLLNRHKIKEEKSDSK